MQLTIHEREKLEISLAAIVARRRLDRGVKLNYPETSLSSATSSSKAPGTARLSRS